jgi:hypothetical protein
MTSSFARETTSLREFARKVNQLVADIGDEKAAAVPVAFPTSQGGGTTWPDSNFPALNLAHGVTLHEGGGMPDHVLVQ